MADIVRTQASDDPVPTPGDRHVETHRYLIRFDRASAWMRVVDTYEGPDGHRRHRVRDRNWPGL